MRVFVGLTEIAGFAFTYADGFRRLGHETYTAVIRKNPFYPSYEYDEVLHERMHVPERRTGLWRRYFTLLKAWVILLSVFLKALTTCDTFLFLFGSSFLPDYWDYFILKWCGKRIVSVFLGDDIRYWYAYQQEMRMLGLERELEPSFEIRKRDPSSLYEMKIEVVRAAERYAYLILSDPVYAQLQTRPYMYADTPLDLMEYRFHVSERNVPVILHAPSDRALKGTEHVLAAIKHLEQEGIPFQFKLVEGVPNDRLRELLTDADIVVDQLYGHGDSTLTLESLAAGNVVLARHDERHLRIRPDCPVVNVNADTLTDQLRKVILDPDLRRELAFAGRKYVEKHYSHVQVVQRIVDWLKPGGIEKYDFVPTFFRSRLVIPKELLKEEHLRRRRRHGGFGLRIRYWLRWPLLLFPSYG
jgi:glycosyltransferase involved in cell wall biosynthesis